MAQDTSRVVVIRAGTVIDGRWGAPLRNVTIVVRGERIAGMGITGGHCDDYGYAPYA